jgi:hypothetical protein
MDHEKIITLPTIITGISPDSPPWAGSLAPIWVLAVLAGSFLLEDAEIVENGPYKLTPLRFMVPGGWNTT